MLPAPVSHPLALPRHWLTFEVGFDAEFLAREDVWVVRLRERRLQRRQLRLREDRPVAPLALRAGSEGKRTGTFRVRH
jgi:hypothetical protein